MTGFWRQIYSRRRLIAVVLGLLAAWGDVALFTQPSFAQSPPADARPTRPAALIETPELIPLVKSGVLPAIGARVPLKPRVVDLAAQGRTPGRHGGTMRMLMGREKDLRILVYYGYARLIGYNSELELAPDILESFDVEEGRRFTLRLRPGHRWSDGHPFTSEDFRFFWEDVANNKALSRGGPHKYLRADDKLPVFEVLDKWTVRYTWPTPNPYFLPALAGTRALYIFAPSHYLRQFHEKYAAAEKLKKQVEAENVKDWAALFRDKSDQVMPTNTKLPSLEAWVNTTAPPSTLYRFKRNPYFHRIDTAGRQLPYINQVTLAIGSTSLIPAKTGSGDSDLQGRYLLFDNYTFLKAAEKRGVIKVNLWDRGVGSAIAIYPNMTTNDATWRAYFQDVRVRRALSLAINRREINEVIYFGLARESANTVLPASPLYRPEYAHAYTRFDLRAANQLLDEAGLKKRDPYGIRLLP
ncbi:MAG TPA: ABC transporter substrate-binding protein, partial [Hyphomicrobiaceae bacterium]|nr:ABC transporter substrate-binding protein [Hyphomicrobiaceae bacterium]